MNVLLELFDPYDNFFDTPMEELLWVLTIDGKPFPCEEKCTMTYEDALGMIGLAKDIEGTVDD